jgi:hypothetical protein
MPKLTQEQLEAIRQRARNATPGPWGTGDGYEQSSRGNYVWSVENGVIVCAEQDGTDCVLDTNDATFIAYARTDIPALLEHIEALEAENHRYKRAFEIITESNIRPWDSAKGMFMAHTMMVRKARRMIAEGDSYKTVNEKEDDQ